MLASGGGLNADWKKLSNSKFCLKLLRPSQASQFEDNDPHKMGHAAISATLSRAQAARPFMICQITELEMNSGQRALQDCLNKVGSSVDSLRQPAREFNDMEKAEENQRNASSSMAQNACYDLLNGVEVDGEVTNWKSRGGGQG